MKQRCAFDKEMGIIRTKVKLLFVLPYLIGITHHVPARLALKSNVDEHPEKLSNSNPNLGLDIPLDRRATSSDGWGHTLRNAEEPFENIGNMFENWKILRTEKQKSSTPPMKLPKPPLDRWATSLDDWGDSIDNAEEPLEKIGNMFENSNHLRAEKKESSTPPIQLPKIFSWRATGSISFARSLSKSLLDLFEYYFGDVPGLGAPFILWDFFYREVLQGT